MEKFARFNIEGTKFIYRTNFSGDPSRDNFGDDRRKAQIVVPDEGMAREMTKQGFPVKATKPSKYDDPETFVPTYYVEAQIKYRARNGEPVSRPSVVYLVNDSGTPVVMTEETVGMLDNLSVEKVDVVLTEHRYVRKDGTSGKNFYVHVMYVYQDVDDDPYASKFRNAEEAPF